MGIGRLYTINLIATIASACLCAIVAYLVTYVIGFVFFREAFMFRLTGGSIDTSKLRDYDQMQMCLVWTGVGIGVLLAQSVFLVRHLRPQPAA